MMTKPTHFPSPPARWNSHSPLLPAATTFLDECFLCKQKLLLGKDIYMYKGDRAFCMWSWCKDGAQPWKCSCCLP
ncbi:hypothetical protein CK203_039373 [Vitis vinifera]|nr:hypothetical protein CK203_039373 [Vitis vinifera]